MGEGREPSETTGSRMDFRAGACTSVENDRVRSELPAKWGGSCRARTAIKPASAYV